MARASPNRPFLPSGQGVWGWAVAGLFCGALWATLQFAPAVWLQKLAFAASNGRLVLREAQGTVWQGSAQLGLTGGPGSRDAVRLPGRVQWDLRLGWGSVHIALQADCCTALPHRFDLLLGIGQWRLQVAAAESTWPAAVLSGLGTPWNTLDLQGPLVLKTPGLSLVSSADRLKLEGALSLDMPDLSSRLSTLRPLGSYRLLMQGGEPPTLDLRTTEGRLQLQGTGQWTAGQLRFGGEASADPAFEAELNNLLNIMGQRDGARSVITLG